MSKSINAIFQVGVLCGAAVISCDAWSADSKPASSLLQLEDGRSGKGNLIATTGVRGIQKPTSAGAHALILTIGDYQGNIPKLKGVPYDTATATEIAKRMGVPSENIVALKDNQLTLEGMRNAFAGLESRLSGNDQVFIYYSGHGGRQLVKEDDNGERCAESLITVDGYAFTDTELEQTLKRISQKAQKSIVFIDACHSGGVTTRALGTATPLYAPKSYTPPGQSCVKPTNVVTRNLMIAKAPGSGAGNYVHIAAARDNEISLDQPGRGGVASQAWLACLNGAAKDLDGSGALSAQEIQTCAQDRIDKQLSQVQGYLPHHVTITGNNSMVLGYAMGAAVAAPVVPSLPLAPVVSATKPEPQPPAQPNVAAVTTAPPSPLSALQDIHNSRDDRKLVTIQAANPKPRIGKDLVDFSVTAREGGYLYLLMVGSDGTTFDMLFPNQIDQDNRIEAGATMRLPRPQWQLTASGPVGKNTLLAIVSQSPRDFSNAGLKPSGPFSSAPSVAAKDIQLITANQASTNADCRNADLRILSVRKNCLGSYASAMLTIEEVQ